MLLGKRNTPKVKTLNKGTGDPLINQGTIKEAYILIN